MPSSFKAAFIIGTRARVSTNKLLVDLDFHLYLQFSNLVLSQEQRLKIDQRVQSFYSLCTREEARKTNVEL